jgi:hypothetical protein
LISGNNSGTPTLHHITVSVKRLLKELIVVIEKVATVKINAARLGRKASGELCPALCVTGYAIVLGDKVKALGIDEDLRSLRSHKMGWPSGLIDSLGDFFHNNHVIRKQLLDGALLWGVAQNEGLGGLRVRERRKEEEDDEYEEQPSGILRNWHCELHLIQMGWWGCYIFFIEFRGTEHVWCSVSSVVYTYWSWKKQSKLALIFFFLSLCGIFMDTINNHNMDSATVKKTTISSHKQL